MMFYRFAIDFVEGQAGLVGRRTDVSVAQGNTEAGGVPGETWLYWRSDATRIQ